MSTQGLFALFSRFAGVPLVPNPRESRPGHAVAEHLFSEGPYNATTFSIDERGGGYDFLARRERGPSRLLAGVFVPRDFQEPFSIYKTGFLEAPTGDRLNFDLRVIYQSVEGKLTPQEVLITRARLKLHIDFSNPEIAYLMTGGRRIEVLNYTLNGNQLQLSGEAISHFLGMGGPTVGKATVTLPDVGGLAFSGRRAGAMRLLKKTISELALRTESKFGNPIGWAESVLKSKSLPGVAAVMAIGIGMLLQKEFVNRTGSDT